jgi:hypothetical protein
VTRGGGVQSIPTIAGHGSVSVGRDEEKTERRRARAKAARLRVGLGRSIGFQVRAGDASSRRDQYSSASMMVRSLRDRPDWASPPTSRDRTRQSSRRSGRHLIDRTEVVFAMRVVVWREGVKLSDSLQQRLAGRASTPG